MNRTQTLTPTFPCSPVTHMNERVWGVFHPRAESHLTQCSQLVPSQLWLDTEGVPDRAESVLEGSVLLQNTSDLSDLTGLSFSPPSALENQKGFLFLCPSSVWKTVIPVDHTVGEQCRGMQQASPTCSAHVHPQCSAAVGSGRAVLLTTVPGLAGTRGSSPPLTKCFRPHSQNNFDILGKERNLTRHCAWLAKLSLTA